MAQIFRVDPSLARRGIANSTSVAEKSLDPKMEKKRGSITVIDKGPDNDRDSTAIRREKMAHPGKWCCTRSKQNYAMASGKL